LHDLNNRPPTSQAFTNPEIPDIVGSQWFESLRHHISEKSDAAHLRSAVEIQCDKATVVALSNEINRLEKQWLDEVHKGCLRRMLERGR
jgi:hypothetical protein